MTWLPASKSAPTPSRRCRTRCRSPWVKGTVDEAIAKRRGEGFHAEGQLGLELPRELRVRLFLQFTVTVPLYHLRDIYKSRDSTLDVWAAEGALGVRF